MTIYSADGTIAYSDGHPLSECMICHEEHTDIREGEGFFALVICIYCANDRRPEYRPARYLGNA